MKIAQTIADLFATRGGTEYHGEAVSQLDHALQCAALAEGFAGDDAAVVAALLHDIGHLIGTAGESAAQLGIDECHEDAGARFLSEGFGPEVLEPIRLHVAAKRYLCATDPEYTLRLSLASRRSLALQGGPMNNDEIRDFEANPFFRAAVDLRRWDDLAKVPNLRVPNFDHYRQRIDRLILTPAAS